MTRWRRWLWLGWAVVGACLVLLNLVAPRVSVRHLVLYDAVGVLSVLMILVGVWLNRPRNPGMWLLFAAGNGCSVTGDLIYAYHFASSGQAPFPSLSDAFYLLSGPLVMAGLWLLIRRSPRRDRAGPLDALIVASGFGLVVWSIVIRPIVVEADLSLLARTVLLGAPFTQVLMFAMLAWVATTAGSRTDSYRLLVAALALLEAGNIFFSLLTALTTTIASPTDVCFLLSYVTWAAAALHPSMREMAERVGERDTSFSRARVVTIVGFVLIPAVVLGVQGVRDPGHIDWLPIALTTGVLCLLMLARAAGLVGRIREQSASMVELALHDELTGLPNRRLFERAIGEAVRAGGPLQVALVDLNDFKMVNDRLGHIMGDQLLVEFGRRLRSVLRAADLVARLGGDEFALLMHGSPGDADRIVARVLDQLAEPVTLDGHQVLMRASIGLADAVGATEPLEVVRRADIAMYAAKNAGAGPQRYRPELEERAVAQARLTAELRHALDNGEFHLEYQPIVGLPDGRLAGVEALLRWEHPELGAVGPERVIPIADKTGLIVPLGRWVLDEACRQLRDWDTRFGAEAPARISVNISGRQLTEPGFAEAVTRILADNDLHADRLTVEVTETAVLTGGRAVAELAALHDLGVCVALDDFGTGHASLSLLQTVPVDVLKVDRAFVDGITHQRSRSVIASALIDISAGLNLTAIAEGVETAEQAGLLFELGYRFAQGYHFGRPAPAGELTRWLAARPPAAAVTW